MKLFRFAISFAPLAMLGTLSAATPSYKVTLTETAVIGNSVMKAGDYKIVVAGDKATLTSGKTTVEVPVKVETGDKKFAYTSIECAPKRRQECCWKTFTSAALQHHAQYSSVNNYLYEALNRYFHQSIRSLGVGPLLPPPATIKVNAALARGRLVRRCLSCRRRYRRRSSFFQ